MVWHRYLAILPFVFSAPSFGAFAPHPRIWITPSLLSDMQNLRQVNDPLWTNFKAQADTYKGKSVFKYTIISATNANPVVFTTKETVYCSGDSIFFAGFVDTPGFSNGWSTLNTLNTRAGFNCTAIGTNSFQLVGINSTNWGALTGASSILTFLGTSCDPSKVCYPYEGFGFGQALEYLGLAYAVSGDTSYVPTAQAIIDYVNQLTAAKIMAPLIIDVGFPARILPLGMGLAYDWMYSQLTPSEQTASAATINAWYDFCVADGGSNNCYAWQNQPTNNYWAGYLLGLSMFALATGENAGGNSRALEIYDYWLNQWNNNIPAAFQTNGTPGVWSDGYVVEGSNYGPQNHVRLLEYILGVNTSIGVDLSASNSYASKMQTAYEYFMKPDRWRTVTDQSQPGSCAGVVRKSLPVFLSYVLNGTSQGAFAQFQYQNFANLPPNTSTCQTDVQDDDDPMSRLLYYRSSRTATDYRTTEPAYNISHGTGHVIWRSDWTDSAQWSEFIATPMYASGKYSKIAGHITLARGADQLIIGSNYWFGTNGVFGNGISNSYGPSNLESTLYFDDGGAYQYTGGAYVGGQAYYGGWQPFLSKQTATFSYGQGDLTEAYDRQVNDRTPSKRSLRYWYRDFAAMPGGVYLVLDRARAISPGFIKHIDFNLSPEGTPTVSGTVVSNTVHSSSVFLSPIQVWNSLGPSAPSVSVTPVQSVTYVAQIADTAVNTDFNALTLVYAAASNATQPSTTLLTSSPNAVAAQIAAATPDVFVHATVVTDNLNNTYSPTSQTTLSFISTHSGAGNYLIGGLNPGTYTIVLNGSLVGNQSVGVDGTMYFTGNSGTYLMTQQGSPCDVNGDGVVNSIDVQWEISEALGVSPCVNDLDGNGVCNVVDVQRIVNAANGSSCRIGP
jgi:hypothetical protein